LSATDLMSVLLDSEREPNLGPSVDDWEPVPEPTAAELVAHSLKLRAASPSEFGRTALSAVRGPRRAARQALDAGRGIVNMRNLINPNAYSTLNGPIGPHRTWDWARARLADIKEIRAEHSGTINDIVLAVITAGFRDLLASRGEQLDGRVIRTLVPVSVRTESERGTPNNKVSAMFAELPVGVEDPIERVRVIHDQMQDLKQSGQAVAAERLTALGGFAPGMLLALGGRVATRLPQSSVNTVTTNVPGPQRPLYLAGRRMLEAFPFVPIGGYVRVGIAIFSYDGAVNFGVTGDRDTAPDIDVLSRGIERGVEELLGRPTGQAPESPPRAVPPQREPTPHAR
jgi:WS/DGAT/MGAT family acyltransferase